MDRIVVLSLIGYLFGISIGLIVPALFFIRGEQKVILFFAGVAVSTLAVFLSAILIATNNP